MAVMLKTKWSGLTEVESVPESCVTKPLGDVKGAKFVVGMKTWPGIMLQTDPCTNESTRLCVAK